MVRLLKSSQGLAIPECWAVLTLVALVWGCAAPQGDPLARAGVSVTTGAAAGYVPDLVCANCHADLYQSFQEVGMARSFYRPRADRMIEDFAATPFYHSASERYYRMRRDGEKLFFERYQLDSRGSPIHRFEVEVDWILGSGHTSRTYLFQTQGGEIYQFPLAWYSQTGRWGMAPGFDHAEHPGLERLVRQECMFCHNAYPDVPEGSDAYGAPQVFPADLPEGIGCQRCHGPGADHVRAALKRDEAAVRSTIVHPGRLPPERAVEICYGCHFQPSVALAGLRRFGRANYSWRPGEPLIDYLALLDVDEEGQSRDQRFEINHHPYRLEQSTCFLESEPGALTCTRCHDPHRKVPPQQRKEHYRNACLSCHQLDACSLDAMSASSLRDVAADDCATCHMPRRRTQDVVQVVMTDHRIQRRPGGPELLVPLQETVPTLVDAELIRPLPDVTPHMEKIYRANAVIRAGSSAEAVDFLTKALRGYQLPSPEPRLDLIRGLLGQWQFAEAEKAATKVLERWPNLTEARNWRAIARVQLGAHEEALDDLVISLAEAGERPEPLFNQGVVLFILGRYEESVAPLRRAVALRSNFPRAWTYLGRALKQLGQLDEAEETFRRALSIDPADPRTTLDLGRLLVQQDRRDEALRILEHGARHARHPEEIVQVLAELGGDP